MTSTSEIQWVVLFLVPYELTKKNIPVWKYWLFYLKNDYFSTNISYKNSIFSKIIIKNTKIGLFQILPA
jgi:hypothetical protein